MDSQLVCCLCSYNATNDFDLESHIDTIHSDIFRSKIKIEADIAQPQASSSKTPVGPHSQSRPHSQVRGQSQEISGREQVGMNKIEESYKLLLHNQRFDCSDCGFFSMNVTTLSQHMEKKHGTSQPNPVSAEASKKRKSLNDLEDVEVVKKKRGRRNLSLAAESDHANPMSADFKAEQKIKKSGKGKAYPSIVETNSAPDVKTSITDQIGAQEEPLTTSSMELNKGVNKGRKSFQDLKDSEKIVRKERKSLSNKEIANSLALGSENNLNISNGKRGRPRKIEVNGPQGEAEICNNISLQNQSQIELPRSDVLIKAANKRGRKSNIIIGSSDVIAGDATAENKSFENGKVVVIEKGRRSPPIKLETDPSIKSNKKPSTISGQNQEESSKSGNFSFLF